MRHSRHTRIKLGTYILGTEQSFHSLREDWETCEQEYPQVMASLDWPENMDGVLRVTVYGINHMQEVIDTDVEDLLNDAKGG